MNNNIQTLPAKEWPEQLHQVPEPPETLFIRGSLPREVHYICIVGARSASPYGLDICERLVEGLAGYPVAIVSGLALGIDACAHRSALKAHLPTIAFPGSGLADHVLYPRSNIHLAEDIMRAGGALISEYEPNTVSAPWAFPRRNRLMAGLSELTIVIECSLDSGSLITARLALDYNKSVGAVPGSIFSRLSTGPHYLLRQGAILVESSEDILKAIGFDKSTPPTLFDNLPTDEQKVADALDYPLSRDALFEKLACPIHELQITLARMEIKGLIEERMGEVRLKKHR